MSDTITLSRSALTAAIAAYLLQESHNSWIAGTEGFRPINETEAAEAAARLVETQVARATESVGGFKPGYRHHLFQRTPDCGDPGRHWIGTGGWSGDCCEWDILETRWISNAADLAAWEQAVKAV